jgi:hypothetical protein
MTGLPQQINVLAELERCGIVYEWAGEDEIKTCCPFHADNSPSASINVDKRLFRCQASGCLAKGDFVTFLVGVLKSTRVVVLADLSKRYTFDDAKIISTDLIERYHSSIWEAKPLLKELYVRGITDADIRQYRLGENDGRITIPITNETGLYVNIRKYLPGAPGKDKMRNVKGHSRIRLFPIRQLEFDDILLCGGECKAIVAASQLNAFGIGAITTTAGEGNWDVSFTPQFSRKRVWVCYDIDKEGQVAAQALCAQLHRVADWIGNVVLPLDVDKYPHGDINDYAGQEHGTLKELLDACDVWQPKVIGIALEDTEPEIVALSQAMHARWTGKRISVSAVISAMDTAPYIIPALTDVQCDKSQKECAICPVYAAETQEFKIHPETASILEMVSAPRTAQRDALMRAVGIPPTCSVVNFVAKEYFNVEDVRISPQLEISNRSVERVMQPALCIGAGLELNESYALIGRMYPHPKTQQSTLLISAYEPTKDALSTYEPDNLERLKVFQPHEWTSSGICTVLDNIYSDLEANVTRIYQRRDIHIIIDLAYHSPLLLNFDGKCDIKGWVEVLVVGDSAQGKSETALNLMQHYGLGEKVECKNASVAGLLGGLQQLGSRWFVTWGIIPTHDKRLVILEELKGANIEVIAKLTDMRSSGIAEIPKIEKRRTFARTRLIALSNPRTDHPMSAYNFGIEAVKELIGGLEDIRRFDMISIVASNEIDPAMLNQLQSNRPAVMHTYTSDLCRALILWAWTRTANQVQFDEDAVAFLMESSTNLCEEFSDALPIIDRGSTRHKLARLCASVAARTYSCATESMEVIRVRRCHVEFIVQHLRRIYQAPAFGYGDYTAAIRLTQELVDEQSIKHRLNETPFPRDFIKQSLHTATIDLVDIQDWCAWDRSDANDLLSFLVRKHALTRDGRTYRKTPPYIRLLKGMLDNGSVVDRPDFVKERKEEF